MLLNFKEFGEGKALIILHGLFGSLDNWATMAKELSKNFRVIVMDLRNHGNSPHSDEWNYAVMAADVQETMEHLNLEKAMVAGHSMGGKTAIVFAELFPEKIEKLMVIDIAPRYYPPHHQEILKALFSLDLNRIQTRKEAEEKLSEGIKDIGTRQFLLKNLYWLGPNQLAWKFNLESIANHIEIVGSETPLSKNNISTETLFVKGNNSNYIKAADEKNIAEIFPHSKLVGIDGAGHWVHAEKPLELLRCFKDFFEN